MKAIVNTIYGPPEVLQLNEVEKPVPKENEVLINIHAATVNRTDCGFRKPEYLIIRFFSGFFKPKRTILGNELAGEIEAVGKHVTRFKPGEQVFGLSTYKFGTHAEYICMPETGSIGSACVQLAKHYGAHITAVCKTENFELVKSLGATEVIDYTKEDFSNNGKVYDVVIDAVGKSSFFRCKKILKPGGTYFSTELGYLSQNVFLALTTPLTGGKKVKFPIPTDNQKDIVFFKELIEAGHYKAVIDRVYTLEEIVEATTYVETGQKTGNVVITM